jgi:hypothetical protein
MSFDACVRWMCDQCKKTVVIDDEGDGGEVLPKGWYTVTVICRETEHQKANDFCSMECFEKWVAKLKSDREVYVKQTV